MKKVIKISIFLLFIFNANAQNIAFTANELYPEGIAYSKKQDVFFVSSLHYGKIGKVTRKGEYSEFISDKDLVSTIGIHANEKANLRCHSISLKRTSDFLFSHSMPVNW